MLPSERIAWQAATAASGQGAANCLTTQTIAWAWLPPAAATLAARHACAATHRELQLRLRQRQRLAGGHAQLPLHQVHARHRLGHRVLHLAAGGVWQHGPTPSPITLTQSLHSQDGRTAACTRTTRVAS